MGSMPKSFVLEQWDREDAVCYALLKSEIERHVAELARTHAVSLADVHFNVTDGKVTVILDMPGYVKKLEVVNAAAGAVVQHAHTSE